MLPLASRRARATDAPIIVLMKELMKGKKDVLSLAQGVVHWSPPEKALAASGEHLRRTHAPYTPAAGVPALVDALQEKIQRENNLVNSEVMATAGANQAYVNAVLALLDGGDRAAVFAPFYFNHVMAIQMTGAEPLVLPSSTDGSFLPDLDALERAFSSPGETPRVVTLVNPGNPTGTLIPLRVLERARSLCDAFGAFLVVDNTYEYFVWGNGSGEQHRCVEGDRVVNLFSFSKAYGAMGWRLGYVAYPAHLRPELEKIQDTIVITPTGISQAFALGCLQTDRAWFRERRESLEEPRRLLKDALERALPPGSPISDGSGAIYFLAKLSYFDDEDPSVLVDDVDVTRRLVDDYGVAVIPGSACGAPGTIRVCYSNLPLPDCRTAADRLFTGLSALLRRRGK